MNQSILYKIRAYVKADHSMWDTYISHFASALRSDYHQAIGTSPYYALFGQHMVTHSSAYAVLRKLDGIKHDDTTITTLSDRLALIRERITKNLQLAHEKGAKTYNTRTREVNFKPGQEVFRRNFSLSSFAKGVAAKFNKKFLKCRITRKVGNSMYEIEDLQGKPVGVFHAKDLRQ